ncbi:MAG: iron chelate uptake ABC transporter family permease subunit [Acidimicrobiales bacterium]|nr:iron chelate uptake ABC transporter family permease subunit [Acidimicrobiales bacterium]
MTAATAIDEPVGRSSLRHTVAAARSGQVFALRVGPVSARVDGRSAFVSILLALVVTAGLAWNVSVGDFPIPIGDVIGELTGLGGNESTSFIIRTLRLPRALTAVLVGAAFGVSGQIFQRMVRNPLASPDILGVSAGAAAGAVSCIVLVGATSTVVTGSALAGSVGAVAAIYLLAVKNGLSSYRLVLIGIGITAMLNAYVAYLLTRAELYDAQRATVWLTGSLNGRGWEYVRPLAVLLGVLVPVTVICARQLRALELGDEAAHGLGVGLRRSKLALSLSGAALAAVATAAAGPVGFVALVAPQIARRLVGARSAALVPAALVGAAIMVYGDLVARRAFAPIELPVGVVTAVVGAPYLLWLLTRSNRTGSGG